MGPEAFRAASAQIDEAAGRAGRDPGAIRRIYNLSGTITDGARGDGHLDGPVDHWIETLARWAEDLGVDTFVFWPADSGVIEIERFANEIVPAVRQARSGGH